MMSASINVLIITFADERGWLTCEMFQRVKEKNK